MAFKAFLFDVMILGFAADERVGLLIFGAGLIFLTIGLRWILKGGDDREDGQIEEIGEKANR